MKYKGVKIKEFSIEYANDRKLFDVWLLQDNIEVVDILTTPAISRKHGLNYVIYSVIYREIGDKQ